MFKVGDIVIGANSAYRYSGIGSRCRVTAIFSEDSMEVEIIMPLPDYCRTGERCTVASRHFFLETSAPPPKPMKLEPLKVFTCDQQIYNGEACGELATTRVTIPGLSLTLCLVHARPYLEGKKTLEVVTCTGCGGTCKPGYLQDRDYSRPFCNVDCQQQYYLTASGTLRAYAPRPVDLTAP